LKFEVQGQAIVDVSLDVVGNLSAADAGVTGKFNLDRDVDQKVVIGMDVEGDGRREKRRGVEKEVDLGQVCGGRAAGKVRKEWRLREGNMLDCLAVTGFGTDVGGDVTRGGKTLGDSEGGEEPRLARDEIVVGDGVGYAVGAGPSASGKRRGTVLNLDPRAGGKGEVYAAGARDDGFEDGCAGFVVGTGDAAGCGSQGDVSDGPAAAERCHGLLK
jgi:hypothetical protein